ncbi:MAG TPA: MATE family efflux transporter [Candidatus Binatia bacterium]|nr:MATE family efflux transporter [Candidatus Binatia bacterium]
MNGEAEPLSLPAEATPTRAAVGLGSAGGASLRRVVWSLAWPVIVTMLSESLVGLVDMLMVSRLGPAAVAGVGVGAQILGGVSVTMTAVGTGTLALVARYVGARHKAQAERVLGQSVLAAFALACVVIVPVIAWPYELVRLFGVEPNVVVQGGAFVRVVMLAIPASAVSFVIASALRGAGDTRTPLAIGLVVNALNVLGNWVFIFGKLGFPALGVRGSGVATTLAFTSGMALGLWLLARGRLRLRLGWGDLRFHFSTIRRVLSIGSPAAVEQGMMQVGFFVYLLFAARYGTDAVAAYFIGVRILALSFLPGFGFAAAAAALVGQNLGAGKPDAAEHSGWLANWMSVALMSATGVFAFVFSEPIARLFVDQETVIAGTASFIHMLAFSQPLMAMDFTLGGALRGAGDTRFPLLTVLIAFYGCRLGFAFVVVSLLGLGLPWLWAALIPDYIMRATLKAWRFRRGTWKTIAV